MTYTFLSARFANAERSAIVAETKEAGSVAFSEADTPREWAALHEADISIADYQPPAEVDQPDPLQALRALLAENPALAAVLGLGGGS